MPLPLPLLLAADQTALSTLWAYVTLGITCWVAEEAAPVVAGFAAHEGHFDPGVVVIAIWIASWFMALALYGVGRWRYEWVRRRFPKVRRLLTRLLRATRQRPWRASLATRWAFGFRLTLPLACGAAHISLWRYVTATGASALAWAAVFTGIGWAFGETAVFVIGKVRRYEVPISIGIVVVLGIVALILHQRMRGTPETVHVPGLPDEDQSATR